MVVREDLREFARKILDGEDKGSKREHMTMERYESWARRFKSQGVLGDFSGKQMRNYLLKLLTLMWKRRKAGAYHYQENVSESMENTKHQLEVKIGKSLTHTILDFTQFYSMVFSIDEDHLIDFTSNELSQLCNQLCRELL